MEDIIGTTILNYENSTFLIDLVKHNSDLGYIKITQTINASGEIAEIKLNPMVIPDILKILTYYNKKFSANDIIPSNSYFAEHKQKEIIKRYMAGVPIEELPIQFNCTEEIIKIILSSNNLPLVDNRLPKKSRVGRNRRNQN